MRSPVIIGLVCMLWGQQWCGIEHAQAGEIDFNRDIRPILSRNCIACHGPDEEDRQAGLRLDTFEGATEDFGDYAALAPGDPDASEMIVRITSDDPDLQMPPPEHADPLPAEDLAMLRKWIQEGGQYAKHWSFAPIRNPPIPKLTGKASVDRVLDPIDAFVLRRARQAGLSPNPTADPWRLARRVCLDLTGLPPGGHDQVVRDAIQRYLDQPNQATLGNMADRLMESTAYAEHWAAMWLDIARYADTVGYAGDEKRNIWPWRDWLIQSLGQHKSYRELAIEMIAGDLLPAATLDQKLATAFHRNTLSNNEGGTNDEEFRTIAVKDRLSTTMNTWMGLTVRCAECHSHKYDPISHNEYYQLLDYFNQSADADRRDESPKLAIPIPPDAKTLADLDRQIVLLEKQIGELEKQAAGQQDPSKGAEDKSAERKGVEKKSKTLKKKLEQLRKRRDRSIQVPVMRELPKDKRRETFVMLRGSFLSPGEKVDAALPMAFQWDGAEYRKDRLGLTQWMFDPRNPLTARVAVNRYWARMMGMGLVETEEDFGTQGTPPSHPDLLDHLAHEFIATDWNVEALLKRIVLSSTYQQSPKATPRSYAADPRNRFLSRGPRVRLSAEVVRDQALAVSGLLSRKMYGPPVYPPSPIKRIVNAFTGGMTWVESQGEDRYRRAIYTYMKRSSLHPLFGTFDMAGRDVCNLRRLRTNTPLQSFMTLNDITFIEAARALADRMLEAADEETMAASGESSAASGEITAAQDEIAIRAGLQRALFVAPQSELVDALEKLLAETEAAYRKDPQAAAEILGLNQPEDAANQNDLFKRAALTVVSNVILNLDPFLNN
ncbi:MAG: PSD1 and planctomycete cytochrome C domain-containing protein [Planctomycetota bacterium]